MRSQKRIILWARLLTVFVFLMGVCTWIVGMRVYKKTFKTKPHEITMQRFHQRKIAKLETYEHQRFMVESTKNKYNIEAIHISSKIETNRAMIIVHGIRGNYYDLLPVAFRYLEDGYNVIMYNQRQSGLTGGSTSTFGFFEKYDLEEIATVTRRIYRDGKIGVHGFSMGAATAILQSEENELTNSVDFYILDAPFHTMASAVELGARYKSQTKIPMWYVLFSGSAVSKLKHRISYKDVVPLEAMSKTTKPVLLLHGELDAVTSADGSRQLFSAINHNMRRLEIFEGEGHCTAHYKNEKDYFERVHKFISDYV